MTGLTEVVVENVIGVAAAAWGFYLLARFAQHRWFIDESEKELLRLKEQLAKEQTDKKAERAGRIRAEQELRKLQMQVSTASTMVPEGQDGSAPSAGNGTHISFPLRPIGYLHSCFDQRNGTPRQPLLVPLARSRLQLTREVPFASLEGLEQYSHCWVLYIFHENTDLAKVFQGGDRSSRHSKISVPRLNGAKMGVLATRSPHRPVPIGLSVAQVLSVDGNSITLGGADIVDGSPVLDIKPYLPFCDGVLGASAPSWVATEAENEPLKVADVRVKPHAEASIHTCWSKKKGSRGSGSLYKSCEEYLALVKQVLSMDIRSLHKRLGMTKQETDYHVILDGIDISYSIETDVGKAGQVTVLDAALHVSPAL